MEIFAIKNVETDKEIVKTLSVAFVELTAKQSFFSLRNCALLFRSFSDIGHTQREVRFKSKNGHPAPNPVQSAAQLRHDAGDVAHAPMFGDQPVLHPQDIARG
jgi:hypothetical protein